MGLGEAGSAIAEALHRAGHAVCCFDDRTASTTVARSGRLGITCHTASSPFSAAVELVLVTVQASAAEGLAARLVPELRAGTIYADCTAKSVETRNAIARRCANHRLAFCDIAIADTVSWPDRTVDFLASGGGTGVVAALFAETRFLVRVIDADRPVSAELKLLRSAYTKGLTALILETLCAAEKCGARSEIQRSVTAFMQEDFSRIAELLAGSSIKHSRRRADEMSDARRLLNGLLGYAPMTTATSAVLEGIAQARPTSRADTLDGVIEALVRSELFRGMSGPTSSEH